MTNPDDLRRENEALRDRISRLSAAVLRISASLDLDTVLNEIVESARALTGARYGCITTIDESGEARDFVTSGITPEEHQQMAAWADGPQLFEHLRDLPGPLRLGETRDYVRSLGFSTDPLPSGTLQRTLWGTPMRHRGVHVGNFFLADKAGGQEFTDEDEEVLVLLASQAATAIANARTYRREQRARADLEALVETSPVGVVVFDARTGRPVRASKTTTPTGDVSTRASRSARARCSRRYVRALAMAVAACDARSTSTSSSSSVNSCPPALSARKKLPTCTPRCRIGVPHRVRWRVPDGSGSVEKPSERT